MGKRARLRCNWSSPFNRLKHELDPSTWCNGGTVIGVTILPSHTPFLILHTSSCSGRARSKAHRPVQFLL